MHFRLNVRSCLETFRNFAFIGFLQTQLVLSESSGASEKCNMATESLLIDSTARTRSERLNGSVAKFPKNSKISAPRDARVEPNCNNLMEFDCSRTHSSCGTMRARTKSQK